MAVPGNSITLAVEYMDALDEVYSVESLTGGLEASPLNVRPTGKAGTFEIQKIDTVGAGDYSRALGHPGGNLSITWEAKTYSQDRGRYFTIDAMDELEAMVTTTKALSSFLRNEIVPEVDAYRFAALATAAGTDASAVFSTSAAVLTAWDVAIAAMGEAGVPQERLVAYMAWAPYTLLKNATTQYRIVTEGSALNREVTRLDGIPIVRVPMNRFHTGITLDAGATAAAGGYTNTGAGINFMLVDPAAVFADMKHSKTRMFSPEINQTGDMWRIDYRYYHDAWLLDNHADGVYVHTSTS